MREKMVANNKEHLKLLIESEIELHGNGCNLNHFNISKVTSLAFLFYDSKFNGDISKWDTSNVTNMSGLFSNSHFNGDISSWNTSKVTDMNSLFLHSQFNGDISSWRPLKIEKTEDMFLDCKAPVPYWFGDNNKEVVKNIESYDLFNKINSELNDIDVNNKKLKI